uniref:Ion_trans domain-containing protein n=1 Tax=Macrostomum lignano TaxID=282301 RepID=A0A1I8FAF2_9PLAT
PRALRLSAHYWGQAKGGGEEAPRAKEDSDSAGCPRRRCCPTSLTIALTRLWLIWNHSATWWPVIINLIMLIGLEARPGGANTPTTGQWKADYPSLPDWADAFAYILDALSIIILLAFFVANHPRPPDLAQAGLAAPAAAAEGPGRGERVRESGGQDKLSVRLFSIAHLYLHRVCRAARLGGGTFYSPYFFASPAQHCQQQPDAEGRHSGRHHNGLSLVWVSVLGIAIMYLYAVIGFAKFRIAFRPDDMLVTILRFGLIGDLFENLVPPSSHRNFDEYVWMALFSITFFVLISTIGLNIIFGIIVDTFSQLRDKKWLAETDMRNCCFICSRNNYDFEHHGQGFDHHVRTEHNMWAYIFFFIHLEDTATNDYTSLDLHVHKMRKGLNSFRSTRALCLSAKDEDSTDSKIDELLSNVKDLVAAPEGRASGHLLQDTRHWRRPRRKRQRRRQDSRQPPGAGQAFPAQRASPPHEEEDEDELPRSPSLCLEARRTIGCLCPTSESPVPSVDQNRPRLMLPWRRALLLRPPPRSAGWRAGRDGAPPESGAASLAPANADRPRDDRAPISWKWSRVRVVAGCQARLTKGGRPISSTVGAAVVAVEPMLRLCGLEPHRGCIGRLSGFAPLLLFSSRLF